MSNFKKILLNLFFIPFYWVFSYIIPKKQNLILFGSYFGYKFTGNPKHYYLYLLNKKDSKYNTFWITRNKKIYFTLKKESKPVVYLYSFSGIWKILRAKYLLIEESAKDITGATFLLGNYNIINLWHGVGLKKLSFDTGPQNIFYRLLHYFWSKEFDLYDVITSSSIEFEDTHKKLFKNNKIVVTGYPRNDILFVNKNNLNFKYKKEFKKYKKIIAYLPTYRENLRGKEPFSKINLININSYLLRNNYLFVIKNHPSLVNNSIFDNYSNIVDYTARIDDPQEFLVFVDILITDYSSVVSDFCLMDKPVIFYPFDYEEYIKDRGLIYDYFKILPGPFAEKEKELFQKIKDINNIFSESLYQKKYLEFKLYFNKFIDGNSSSRVYDLMGNLNK